MPSRGETGWPSRWWVGLLALLSTCAPEPTAPSAAGHESVERPACESTISTSANLQAAIAGVPTGGTLCLTPGTYQGPVTIDRELVLWGPTTAVIRSTGRGTTVHIQANSVSLLGLTVDGSGARFDLLDAAVRIEGDDVRVEGVSVRNAVFGILVEKSKRALLRGNSIVGQDDVPFGLRGDPIRLWETYESRVENNRVSAGRDVVVWYSSRNVITGNTVSGGRYGTHFMYSHDNLLRDNRYADNIVAVFVMYSRNVDIRNNLLLDSSGTAGVGLGVKESGNLSVIGNRFVRNTVGAYLDTTPLALTDSNVFHGNLFALGDTGVVFHSSPARNAFRCNEFRGNGRAVNVEGQGEARGIVWSHNRFDDYAGYDLDSDGLGDIPFQLDSHVSLLVEKAPSLDLLRGTPAFAAVELIGRVSPLFEPRVLLVDPSPWMEGECPFQESGLEG